MGNVHPWCGCGWPRTRPRETVHCRGMDPKKLRRTARRQMGLFTRAQARECGFTTRQIRWRIDGEEWRQVLGTVLAPADLPATALILDRAAPLAVSGGVVA